MSSSSQPQPPRPARPSLSRWLAIFAAIDFALMAVVFLTLWASNDFRGMGLDGGGLVALVLGSTGTAVIATVLMGLVFYSDRYGYDEDAHRSSRPSPDDSAAPPSPRRDETGNS